MVGVMDNGSTLTTDEPTSEGPTSEGPASEGPTSEGPTSDGPADAEVAEDHDRGLTCEVSYETGRVIATVAGGLDLDSAPGLERHLRALLMLPLATITIDLTGLDFMDSVGLAALVRVHQMASELRMGLAIEHPSDRVAWMLDLTRLGETVVSDTNP